MTRTEYLGKQVRQLAAVLGLPLEPVWKRAEGENIATVGALVLDSIQPGRVRLYRVVQISNWSGGVNTPLGDGRFTAGELKRALTMALYSVRMMIGEEEYARRLGVLRTADEA